MVTVTKFVVERVEKEGQKVDALIRKVINDETGTEMEREEWTTIPDLDRLFNECSTRWPRGWDLEKLITAIRECEFD